MLFLQKVVKKRIRFDLRNGPLGTTTLSAIYEDNVPSFAFVNAHKIFLPEFISSILCGDISPPMT